MATASTPLGDVRGVELDGFQLYAGIRYAEAPVGDLRFRPPVPVGRWEGELDATAPGPAAPQPPPLPGSIGQSADLRTDEDCLFLNVWTPAADTGRRPVMVWIHGGAYVMGSGDIYNGSALVRRGDVVVVTINYRLGVLGWHDLSHLDPSLAGSGNNGVRDQIEALRWVRDNIAAFGGDPGQVTVFGESAGGGSVAALLAAPEAQGLFSRAIIQSGAVGITPDGDPERYTAELLEALDAPEGGLDALRSAPAEHLIKAQIALGDLQRVGRDAAHAVDFSGIDLRPAIDGVVLTRTPIEALASGDHRDIPLIIGTNQDEGTLFTMLLPQLEREDVEAGLVSAVKDPARLCDALVSRGTGRPILVDLMTDTVFRIPSLRLADAHVAAGGKAWVYLFSWPTPVFGGMLGATHALELPFMWGTLGDPNWAVFTGDEPPEDLGNAMQAAWVAFAQAGDPNGPSVPSWPPYTLPDRPTMRWNTESAVESDPDGEWRRLWYELT